MQQTTGGAAFATIGQQNPQPPGSAAHRSAEGAVGLRNNKEGWCSFAPAVRPKLQQRMNQRE
jgi:hypothetical protein